MSVVGWHWKPWRGLLSLDPVVRKLAQQLPAAVTDLPFPVGLGTTDDRGAPALRTEGPLPAAVAASCAIPWLVRPVDIGGRTWSDGGVTDRSGLAAWRALRPDQPTVLHLIERSLGAADDDEALRDVLVVRSPRSGARMWDLGDVRSRYERARLAALDTLRLLP